MFTKDLQGGNLRRKMKMRAQLKIRRCNVITLRNRQKHTNKVYLKFTDVSLPARNIFKVINRQKRIQAKPGGLFSSQCNG